MLENNEVKEYETSDIGFAAFLKLKGLNIETDKVVKMKNGRFKFVFDNSNDKVKDIWKEYVNSEFQEFDMAIRLMRSMVAGNSKNN